MRKLLVLVMSLLVGSSQAAEFQQLQQHGAAITVQTTSATRWQIEIISPAIFRLRASATGEFTEPGNGLAPIILPQPKNATAYQLADHGEYHLVQTSEFSLRLYHSPVRLALYRADNTQLLWQELQPLQITADQTVMTFSRQATDHFYGGGQQNGHFEFSGKTLNISYSGGWEEGDRPNPAPILLSDRGFAMVQNSWANGVYDLRDAEQAMITQAEARLDSYIVVGDGLPSLLHSVTQLTGRVPLLPRWAFEYGDADCYNDGDNQKKPGTVPTGWHDGPTGTTPDVIQSVAAKYREYDMPGGWILPNDGYGCGYTDLPSVVSGLKAYGFRTGLWTESGVDKIAWEVGKAGTRAQKLDVAWTGKGYQFALDANHLAAQGLTENANTRPFIWTVMGWAGVQRYAVAWTGDQAGSWDYIRWHIPTLIGSGLSGQAYATGDVDGIFGGSPETYTRDLQWKSFTPVLMGMSGWSSATRKHPWWFDEPYRSINRRYLKLKMRLMPYMYGLAREAAQTGAPIVRGLMWDFPQTPGANDERYKDQFLLGPSLLIAPVYQSMSASQGWRRNIYLPEGQWLDYWDGRVVDAPAEGVRLDYQVDLGTTPVFVRAGAILPMYPAMNYDGEKPKDLISFDLYPYGKSQYQLYEDDGETQAYQQGAFSVQPIQMQAGTTDSQPLSIQLGAVQGHYQGQLQQRAYRLQIHYRLKPSAVELDGQPLPQQPLAQLTSAQSGWAYDSTQQGIIVVQLATQAIDLARRIEVSFAKTEPLPATKGYPAAPSMDWSIPADQLLVLNRPAEEAGHPLENAFDGKPATWFRTRRDQSIKTGPHEFTVAFSERRLISGFAIAPRTDQHWQYGQARQVEVYLADNNGDWGQPAYRGTLQKLNRLQRVDFPPTPGRLFRFRILSSQDQADLDPMVSAAVTPTASFNALQPQAVTPISISEFKIYQHPTPNRPPQQRYLADLEGLNPAHTRNQPFATAGSMQMNGLRFQKGLGMSGQAAQSFALQGDWYLLRADIGIDDQCKNNGPVQFQIFGDGKRLYDSGLITPPAVVKPELDIRAIHQLQLRTLNGAKGSCGNWANLSVLGYQGDTVTAINSNTP